MNDECSEIANAEVEEDYCESRDHPACKLLPVSPTSSNVDKCNKGMCLSEEFISSEPYHRTQAKNPDKDRRPIATQPQTMYVCLMKLR